MAAEASWAAEHDAALVRALLNQQQLAARETAARERQTRERDEIAYAKALKDLGSVSSMHDDHGASSPAAPRR